MECASQDPHSYSLYFDLNIWFRGPKSYRDFRETGPWDLDTFFYYYPGHWFPSGKEITKAETIITPTDP